jgi:hypothetical protein
MTPADIIALVSIFFTLVVVIPVVAAAWSDAHKRRLDFQRRELELTADQTAERAAQYAAHVERLEQRVRVLERIATDKGSDLAARIEDLRVPVAVQGELQ